MTHKRSTYLLISATLLSAASARGSIQPSDELTAYGIGTTQATYTGAGQTIAIYSDTYYSTLQSDVDYFSNKYMNGDSTTVTVTNTSGTDLTGKTGTVSAELALDVEYAHLVAPDATIKVVYDSSKSYAAYYAAKTLKASVISISYGSYDSSTATSDKTAADSYYKSAVNTYGSAIFAAAGDSGNYDFPASSPYVVGVGGTNLYVTSAGKWSSETGWSQTTGDTTSGGGGGISTTELLPTYQQILITKGDLPADEKYRVGPDVSIAGAPASAMPVFVNATSSTDYSYYDGSSLATPQWAGIMALVDQARAQNGLKPLNTTDLLTILYRLYGTSSYSTYFHDITTGTNSNGFAANTGFDELTGLGTPKVNALVPYLATASVPEPTAAMIAAVGAGLFLRRRK